MVKLVGEFVEFFQISRFLGLESKNSDTVQRASPFRILVLPGDVVSGTGRQNFNIVFSCQTLRNHPAKMLGTARYIGAVPLNNDRDFHGQPIIAEHGSAGGSPAWTADYGSQ